MMRRNRTLIFIAATTILAVAAGLAWHRSANLQSSHMRSATQAVPLVIGGPKNISMLVIVATDRGFFRDEGLEISYRPIATGKLAGDALQTGDINVGILVDLNVTYAKLNGNSDLCVLASVIGKRDDALLVRADRGIDDASRLVGKTIAVVPATTSDAFLWRFLKSKNIDPATVKLKQMPPQAVQAAFLQGEVDAASIWQPFRFNIRSQLSNKVAELKNENVYTAHALLTVKRNLLEQRSEQLTAILRALIRAEDYGRTHLRETQKILARELDMDPQALADTWGEYKVEVGLDPRIARQMAEDADQIVQTVAAFKGKAVPQFEEMIHPESLRKIDPDRVTTLRP
jgi:sulfonate transport system substrate-binding protein